MLRRFGMKYEMQLAFSTKIVDGSNGITSAPFNWPMKIDFR